MREEQRAVFITDDGKTFFDKKQAEHYEEQLKNKKAYKVQYAPDLNETGFLQKTGYILCYAQWGNDLWVEDWLYNNFGKRIEFVQGVSPTENWKFKRIDIEAIEADKILASLNH